MQKILALDIGTSSVKAAVLEVATATPVGPIARVAYELDHPVPDAAEVPVSRLWNTIVTAVRRAMSGGTTIEGIGLSCLTPALVLLDAADKPLGPIWTHLDRRARPLARKTWAEVGHEFLATVGSRPLPGGISALCYAQQLLDAPGLAQQVRSYLHLNGWLGLHLTGQRAFDRAGASFTGLYGTLTDSQWSDRWCHYFEVDASWLPPVVCGSTTLGALRPAIAAELGISPGLPVKLGTADTSSAMLAVGLERGDLLHVVGTTQVLAVLADNPVPDPRRLTRQFGVGAGYVYVAHNPVGGVALDWMHRLCFREQPAAEYYGQTIFQALKRPTSVRLDPPYLGGDRLEIEICRAGFRELTLGTDRLDLLAAVLDAMRSQHAEALRAIECSADPRRIFLTGGGAEIVKQVIPRYAHVAVDPLNEKSLCGVAKLWDGPAQPA